MTGTAVTTILAPKKIDGNELVDMMLRYADEFEVLANAVDKSYGYTMKYSMDQLASSCRSLAGQALKKPKMPETTDEG